MIGRNIFILIFFLIGIGAVYNLYLDDILEKINKETEMVFVEGNHTLRGPEQKGLFGMDSIMDRQMGSMKYTIKPVASYALEGIIVTKTKYSDRWAWLAPYDLGIAWGKITEKNHSKNIRYTTPYRATYFTYSGGPLSVKEIFTMASNNHIIAANITIERQVAALKVGDVILLKGYLVDVDGKADNSAYRYWHTSLRRDDQGDGACEVFYVESVEMIKY
ncbi:hypothetical protein COV93_03695 [Candidatus Woesearchaeota archaeon CG11_big_fil_rev_8_21_14_0_20_43_8]|nr:MAG: hypothetical protein COV93_03695 [Candidatus Woesearchaeota archaeon CG11_big_fil_rev_8_21_14_0_20_43_8]PIO08959.1 MAG: hypothetical protein COT47_00480 [Candidatus Woesearchaeota archaeon CG08_land_8_20_14_0_20_43_7]